MMRILQLSAFLFLLSWGSILAQEYGGGAQEADQQIYRWPYASKLAPRVGASYEPARENVRLDIGTSIKLSDRSRYELGTDFFTWSRLRSEPNFKFPVEAVDYYFGLYGSADCFPNDGPGSREAGRFIWSSPLVATVRIAHISAHLVDGDPAFLALNEKTYVYSREFVDLSVAGEVTLHRKATSNVSASEGIDSISNTTRRACWVRGATGVTAIFHSIPSLDSPFTPYAVIDAEWQPTALPLTARVGTELRLNMERETRSELSIRLGLKLTTMGKSGLLLEGGYSTGRSSYGQYFEREVAYGWIGFGVGK